MKIFYYYSQKINIIFVLCVPKVLYEGVKQNFSNSNLIVT